MEASKTLRPPSNWQDFESLCKRLWGEIWNCPEIQMNGRLGQDQSGVDVFGIPFNEDNYYGIQCKGKNEYYGSQFTKKEITEEIEKAKEFKPPLKKYYLATTAVNDAKIQEFVRSKNIEQKRNGLFEVHLFAWETIVNLIEENKNTYNFYIKSQNYRTSNAVALTFQNGHTEITCAPKFRTKVTHYTKQRPVFDLLADKMSGVLNYHDRFSRIVRNSLGTINLSFIPIEITIRNTGSEPIRQYKVFLSFEGEIQDLKKTNKDLTGTFALISSISNIPQTTFLRSESMTGKIITKDVLVGDDSFSSDTIFIKPFPKQSEIVIKWKLISEDFKEEGELLIKVVPEIEKEYKSIVVDDPTVERLEYGEIHDCINEIESESN